MARRYKLSSSVPYFEQLAYLAAFKRVDYKLYISLLLERVAYVALENAEGRALKARRNKLVSSCPKRLCKPVYCPGTGILDADLPVRMSLMVE